MDAADRRGTYLRHALAGLQAGVAGGLLMIAWSMVCSAWSHHSAWLIPNIYATSFYGSRSWVDGFTRGTFSGVALMMFICGVGGAIWGTLWRGGSRPFLKLIGAIWGLLIYFLLFRVVLGHINPLIPLYGPEPWMKIGYVLWGIVLSQSPLYSRRIADAAWASRVQSGRVQEVAIRGTVEY